ncbi:MAG: hypothetical protein A2W19_07375 [Spirochaetes bacterium RBG_16_49_21]|nr:MAG: hypothetical protein A2W19_07375 [Spirochaetes bacterium RBG_16_49_21]
MNAHKKLTEAKNHLDGLLVIANAGVMPFSRYQNEIYTAKDAYYNARIEMLDFQIEELTRAKVSITRAYRLEKEGRKNVTASATH